MIKLYDKEDIKRMADKVGGVYQLSVTTDIQVNTLYRLLRGEFKPSFNTLQKLMVMEEEE